LNAFIEVGSALRAVEHSAETLEAQRRALSAARESLAVAEFRFRQGAVSYLDVLVARQQRQRALIDWIGARAARIQSVERLVDSGPAHHRIRGPYPMEELLSAGMLATLHQVRARRRSAAASVYVRARTTGPRFHSRSWPRRGFVENESP